MLVVGAPYSEPFLSGGYKFLHRADEQAGHFHIELTVHISLTNGLVTVKSLKQSLRRNPCPSMIWGNIDCSSYLICGPSLATLSLELEVQVDGFDSLFLGIGFRGFGWRVLKMTETMVFCTRTIASEFFGLKILMIISSPHV